jgi:hypothetical protein
MLGYDRFSVLRLRHIFPPTVLATARFYLEAPDEGPDSFDEEYMGGLWSSEVIDGVSLWFPEVARSQVAILQVSGGPRPDAVSVGRQPFAGPFLDPTWTANANQALAALSLALRIGDAEKAMEPLAAGFHPAHRFW